MSRQTAPGASPMSSMGSRNSTTNTPITQMSMFSPHYSRSNARAAQRSVLPPLREGHDDPFVIDGSKSKGKGKLSATAKPFTLPASRIVPRPSSNDMARKYLEKEIQASYTNMCYGVFTSDTDTSRYLKVTPIYSGLDTLNLVKGSLQSMRNQGCAPMGDLRIEQDGNAVLIKFNNIVEAIAAHNYLQANNVHHCATDYIPVQTWAELTDPFRVDQYSKHEGSVLLRVRFPADVPRDAFEEQVRHLLCEDLGPYTAWQVISAPDAERLVMIAEYFDCSIAPLAVKMLDNKCLGEDSEEEVILISMIEHKPDLKPRTLSFGRFSAQNTPSRRQGDRDQSSLGGRQIDIRDKSVISSFGQDSLADLSRRVGNLSMESSVQNSASFGRPANYLPPFGAPAPPPLTAQFTFPPRAPASLFMGPPYPPPTPSHGFYPQGQGLLNSMGQMSNMNVHQLPASYAHYGHPTPESAHRTGSPKNRLQHQRDSYNQTPLAFNRGFNNNFRTVNHRPTFYKRHHKNHDKDEHNIVTVEAIQMGMDVRTTVMLRNIPNKMTLRMLLQIINQFCFGHYDFLYLRIDFNNNCNVGYAFINFTDPLHIVNFHRCISGQTWGRFHSNKVASISYATIQGRDCLIQKFRNSSVMLEHEHYRPKLYYTLEDGPALCGMEEEFPPVDNPAKLQRSCQNAEQQGLFAPNAGQQVRASQRGRRSQYDRGTTMAEMDEYEFDRYDEHRRLEERDDSYEDM